MRKLIIVCAIVAAAPLDAVRPALATDMARSASAIELEKMAEIRREPRQFSCELQNRYVISLAERGSVVSADVAKQRRESGRPVDRIELFFEPKWKDGHGTFTGSLMPGFISVRHTPTSLLADDVRITFSQNLQRISFTLITTKYRLPVQMSQQQSGEWWLSLGNAFYPNGHVSEYRCEDFSPAG